MNRNSRVVVRARSAALWDCRDTFERSKEYGSKVCDKMENPPFLHFLSTSFIASNTKSYRERKFGMHAYIAIKAPSH
jgi:hypothetical protein